MSIFSSDDFNSSSKRFHNQKTCFGTIHFIFEQLRKGSQDGNEIVYFWILDYVFFYFELLLNGIDLLSTF